MKDNCGSIDQGRLLRRHMLWVRAVAIASVLGVLAVGFPVGLAVGRELSGQRSNQDPQEPVRLKTTLVQVPVTVTDRSGNFVGDLSQKDFAVYEDGKVQQISLFTAIKQPFTTVLVLDTANATDSRLAAIKSLANGFVKQLQPGDRMMIIAFDNEVRKRTEFTSDQAELEAAIKSIESGFGKLLYEAMVKAFEELRDIEGKRSVVLLSDGVDLKSIEATADSVTRLAEEVAASVYVVKIETRWFLEAQGRKQKAEYGDQSKVPVQVDGRIPLPPDFGGPDPTPVGIPKPPKPKIEIGPPQAPPVIVGDGTHTQRIGGSASADPISANLDRLYAEADAFMQSVTGRTGGRVIGAETFETSRSAFIRIAEEMRSQYLLGYYPAAHPKRDDRLRKIRVEVSRRDVQIRARQGYRPTD
ncbi:MAG TPA: VWA domain-containing protein [Blastocatellia bacterium]|nr:VWA domain-containing protein [Blastocatellia bacterium]